MNKYKLISILILSGFALSCGQKQDGVGEFLGLKFGVAQTHPVKDGPRDPPVFENDLGEFYEITFPNQEFSFVGVSLTKNNPADEKQGLSFNKEGMVWASFLNQNKFNCKQADVDKLKKYLEKNYGAKVVKETKTVTPMREAEPFTQISVYMFSPYVSWQIRCSDGEYGNKTLIIRDYSVLKKYGNDKVKSMVDESMKEAGEILKRKID